MVLRPTVGKLRVALLIELHPGRMLEPFSIRSMSNRSIASNVGPEAWMTRIARSGAVADVAAGGCGLSQAVSPTGRTPGADGGRMVRGATGLLHPATASVTRSGLIIETERP
jgi:hypothetical protein